jgi:SAM-dependent methyltransferase
MPDYFDDMVSEDSGVIFQPDVYLRAGDIADRLGAWALVDVGAGSGMKLADISNGRNVIALDYGANLQRGIRRYPQFSWRQYDVEADDALPVEPAELKGTVVICADVIEHVEHPDRLLRALRAALSRGALAVLLSTPDRERTWGTNHLGPPPNTAHVREWTLVEFVELIEREGITCGAGGWTRAHDGTNDLATIEIIATADGATLAATGIARRQRVGKYLRAARPLSHGRLRTARRLVKDALRKPRKLIRSR